MASEVRQDSVNTPTTTTAWSEIPSPFTLSLPPSLPSSHSFILKTLLDGPSPLLLSSVVVEIRKQPPSDIGSDRCPNHEVLARAVSLSFLLYRNGFASEKYTAKA